MKKLYGALFTLSIIWGTSFLFIKLLVNELGPWGVVFWRCLFGTITLLILFFFKKQDISRLRIITLPWIPLIFVALFNNVLPFGLIAMSEIGISSSLASVINATTPIWTIVIGSIFFMVPVRGKQWIGVFVGFVGILLLLNLDFKSLMNENFVGAGTMLAATFCYGLGAQLARKYLTQLPTIIVSTTTLFMSMLISFPFMLVTNHTKGYSGFSFETFLSLIGLGVFGSGFAYLFYYFMVKEGSAEFASLVTYIVPITAMIWGFLLLDEHISANMVIGLLFVFAGVYLSSAKANKKRTICTSIVQE
ncbi:DMT family transporter [Metabacillus bambusae]|uniref:DMT family transporter n=1 Tax=Metabacillus bambusae TaxID=2795218 RepID=A0ABS3MXG1_9BACI|nr:DMT family transporter [Metabacillus bambusae]MBO1510590.1 DMT family transporter [Metabacillus bambusae]